jgi:hypothetical protein
MKTHPHGRFNRRQFLTRGATAASACALAPALAGPAAAPARSPVAPGCQGTLPTGKIGKLTLSRLISGGNLLSGWCHQRDLLFVRPLAAAYLTEVKQFDTCQLLEELGVNSIILDLVQLDTVRKYRQQRGGRLQTIVSVREDWGDWSQPHWPALRTQIQQTIEKGPDLLYLHGGYADRLVQAAKPEYVDIIGKALQFIREQGFSAGLGAHALEVLQACDQRGIQPDYYVKTFHHDRYWSATPKERRKPFCVDGPRSLDHNEFHDNIFCLDPENTAEYMLEKKVPWIAFKVLAAGAIQPKSGFKFAFENGADFIAVGMFDFEVKEDIEALKQVLTDCHRERPWCG